MKYILSNNLFYSLSLTNCHGFVIKRQYKAGEKMRCVTCKKNWKILSRKSHNLIQIKKLRNTNKKLQILNINNKRREKRLRSKVHEIHLL